MKTDIAERVHNETEFYDNDQSARRQYDAALAYVNDGIGRSRRNDAIKAAMRGAEGVRVLEIGSQSWEWCLCRYGYRPERLVCINISEPELEVGRLHAAELGFACEFEKMDAHHLEFTDGSFDMVFGTAILHHLEFARGMREIHRVLRVGGKILFVEPLRHNPVARVVRWVTPKARTADELPLGRPELRLISRNFDLANYYSELFTVLGAVAARPIFANPINAVTRFCDRLDDLILRIAPAAGVYYRSVVICGTKTSEKWRD